MDVRELTVRVVAPTIDDGVARERGGAAVVGRSRDMIERNVDEYALRLPRVAQRAVAKLAGRVGPPAERIGLTGQRARRIATRCQLREYDAVGPRHEHRHDGARQLRRVRAELSVRVAAPAVDIAARCERADMRLARHQLHGNVGQRDRRGHRRVVGPADDMVRQHAAGCDDAGGVPADRHRLVDAVRPQRRQRHRA